MQFRGDGCGHAEVRVWLGDGPLMTGGEFGGGEVIDVMHGPHAPAGRVGTDAVLGVHDVVAGSVEGFPQHGDGAQDPRAHGLAGDLRERHHLLTYPGIDHAEEPAVAAAAERPHGDVLPGGGEGLGQREGVHHAAARLGRIAEQRYPEPAGPGRGAPGRARHPRPW